MPTATQVRQIFIKARVEGSKEFAALARQIGTINQSTRNLSRGFDGLRNVFAAGFFGIGLREIAQALDSFSLLEDRIKVFTGSSESAGVIFEKLGQTAAFTATSVDSLAQSYNRVALATTELGLSQEEIIATTALLQQTFRISGATIAEATASTIQLAQGLSSGQLRGQELRSVLEQNAVFANLLSKELNITRGQLIKFAESGQITSDRVLKALFSNFREINKQASGLSLTIGQALTIAIDRGRFALRDLNKEFEITKNVVNGLFFALDNFKTIAAVIGSVVGVFAAPKILAGIQAIAAALFSIQAAIAVAVGGITFLVVTWEKSSLIIERTINSIVISLNEFSIRANEAFNGLSNSVRKFFGFAEAAADNKAIAKITTEIGNLKTRNVELNKELDKLNKNATGANSIESFLENVANGFNKSNKATRVATGQFAQLNQQFGKGIENIFEYQKALDALQLERINAEFQQGKINLIQYTEQFVKLNSEVNKLGAADQILKGFQLGLNDTFQGLGTLLSNVRTATNAVFGELEDQILNFVKTGKFAFADFTQFVLDEITKIVIRLAIIRPLVQGLFGGGGGGIPINSLFSTSSVTPSTGGVAAKGKAFNNGNVIPFATGGIVNRDTYFPMANNRVGLMGEAGPEAIIPLERGPGGKLGVNASGASGVVVNVNNYSDNNVEVTESRGPNGEKQLDLVITRGVARAIGNGSLDRAFNSNYGLTRRGS